MNKPKTSLTKNEKEVIRKDISDKGGDREIIQKEYDAQIQKIDEDIRNLIQQKEGVSKENILKAFNEEIAELEKNKTILENKKENFDLFIERKKEQILKLGERANKQIELKEKSISKLEERIGEISTEIGELIEQKKGVNKENILKIFDEEIRKLNEEKEKLESEVGIAKNQDTFSVKLVKTLETDKNIQKLYKEDMEAIQQEDEQGSKGEKKHITTLNETAKEKTHRIELNGHDMTAKKIMKKLRLQTLWENTTENIFIGVTKESDIILIDANGEKVRTLEEKCEHPYWRLAMGFGGATDNSSEVKIREGMIPFKKNEKYGFIDKYGKKLIDAEFCSINKGFENGFCEVEKEIEGERKAGIIDKTGKIIIPCKYDSILTFYPELGITTVGVYDKNNKMKYGMRCKDGKEVISFDERLSFNEEGYSIVSNYDNDNKKQKKGIINKDGVIVRRMEYDNILYVNSELRTIEKNGKYGLLNNKGDIIVEPKYTKKIEYGDELGNGLIVVEINKKKGAINKNGDEVIGCNYDNIEYSESKKLLFLSKNGSTEIKDSKGKSLGTFKGNISSYARKDCYHETEDPYNGIGFTKITKGLLGKLNLGGYKVESYIKPDMTDINYHDNDTIIAKKYGRYGVMNISTKKHIINFEYDNIICISKSLFLTKKEGIRSLKNIDTGNETFIDETIEKCEYIPSHKTGIIKATTKEGKIGFVTLEGKMIQKPQFDMCENTYFKDLLTIKKDGKWGLMNMKGDIIVEPKFEELGHHFTTSYGVMCVKKDGKWGIIDEKGIWVINPMFEKEIHINAYDNNEYYTYKNYTNYFSSENKIYFMNGEEI